MCWNTLARFLRLFVDEMSALDVYLGVGVNERAPMVCVCGDRHNFSLWILEFGHAQTSLGYTKCYFKDCMLFYIYILYSSIIFMYTLSNWITSVFHNKSDFIIMYEACSPFLNGCSHIPLKRKQVLGLRTEKVRHFFGSFFRKRGKKKKNILKLW